MWKILKYAAYPYINLEWRYKHSFIKKWRKSSSFCFQYES